MNLSDHIQEKAYNMRWLAPLTQGDHPLSHFPYQVAHKGTATLAASDIRSFHSPRTYPRMELLQDSDAIYIANIPHVPPRRETERYQKFRRMLTQIRDTAGGLRRTASNRLTYNRVCAVVGVNSPFSLDNERNRKFSCYVRQLPPVHGIHYRAYGRFWLPAWNRKAGYSTTTYSKEKAFLIVKLLNPSAANTIIDFNEGTNKLSKPLAKQIPYQLIRQMNASHRFTKSFYEVALDRAHPNPIYLLSLDDDFISITNLFIGYDQIIRQWLETHDNAPHVLSTGYHASSFEKPIYKLGIKLDMKIREAMASVIADGPYYPEPNVMFLLTEPPARLNFVGPGNNLESRRAIHNGISRGVINPEYMIFQSMPHLVTTVPPRMRTLYNEAVDAVTPSKIGQKRMIEAFGGLSQSNFFPKQWADNLYPALPIRKKVTDVTKPLMKLYTNFLPTSLAIAFARNQKGNYTVAILRHFLEVYDTFAAQQARVANGEIELATGARQIPERYRPFFELQAAAALSCRNQLGDLGLKADWQQKVVNCAHASGQAVAVFFREQMA